MNWFSKFYTAWCGNQGNSNQAVNFIWIDCIALKVLENHASGNYKFSKRRFYWWNKMYADSMACLVSYGNRVISYKGWNSNVSMPMRRTIEAGINLVSNARNNL